VVGHAAAHAAARERQGGVIMTADEMSGRIVEAVASQPETSFVELLDAIGDEARGALCMVYPPLSSNLVLWNGVSDLFIEAMRLAASRKKIVSRPCPWLVYFADGAMSKLPVATQLRRYRKPHWFPVAFYPNAG
jgi:hypothetical protein